VRFRNRELGKRFEEAQIGLGASGRDLEEERRVRRDFEYAMGFEENAAFFDGGDEGQNAFRAALAEAVDEKPFPLLFDFVVFANEGFGGGDGRERIEIVDSGKNGGSTDRIEPDNAGPIV
jgi:hypothetical protein